VRVHRLDAEKAIRLLTVGNLRNAKLRVKRVQDYVLIPLNIDVNIDDLGKALEGVQWAICEDNFEEVSTGRTYKDILRGRIPEHVLSRLPSSFDVIGDIAVINLKEGANDVLKYGVVIADALMGVARNVKSVYVSVGGLQGEFRLRALHYLGGERRTKCVHKEYGIKLRVDIAKAYFNPSLAEEHRRVAELVKDGELVADLFAGVGPFTLHIVTKRRAKVFAVDINPDAIKCLLESLKLNRSRLIGEVVAIAGDASSFISVVRRGAFNRVIMNLPRKALDFLPYVKEAVAVGGVIHVYVIGESLEEVLSKVRGELDPGMHIVGATRVLDYSPRKYIFRVDVRRAA